MILRDMEVRDLQFRKAQPNYLPTYSTCLAAYLLITMPSDYNGQVGCSAVPLRGDKSAIKARE